MATLKKGTAIGITDSAYNSIRVGDTLKNIHSGLIATVNKYGQFVCNITGDKLDRDGSNWIVVDDDSTDLDFDLDYRVGQEIPDAPSAQEEVAVAQAGTDAADVEKVPETRVDSAAGPLDVIDTAELLVELKKRTGVLSYFTEDELFDELRSRGFSGTLDQEVRIIRKRTI